MSQEYEQEIEDNRPVDYTVYIMTKKEKLGYSLKAGIILFLIGYVFYQNAFLALLLTPIAIFYPKIKAKELLQKRKNELNFQFKDMLYSLSASMSAGKALEPAFREALNDLKIIYPNDDEYIIKECENIIKNLDMNERIEDVLEDLAERTQIEDIISFVDVLQACRKAGGNIVEVMRTTTSLINDKIEIKNEIDTITASKRFEQKMMSLAPIVMIVLLSAVAGDYMNPVFNTLQGRVIMTFALIIMAITHFISKKLMDINV